MNSRRKNGIFSQIWTGFAAICVFVVLLAGCICFFMMRRYSVLNSINDLSAKAWTVSQIASQPAGITRMLNEDRLYEIQQLTDAQLIYVDRDMNARLLTADSVYALPEEYRTDTDYDLVSMQIIDSLDKELINKILSGEKVAELRRLGLLNTTIVLCGAPIFDLAEKDISDVIGAVILCRPVVDIWSSVLGTLLVFTAGAFISVLLSLVLAWFLSRRIAKPILRLGSTAKELANGEYGITTYEHTGTAELDELGHSLNTLSSRLSEVISTLSNEKSKLEQILRGIGEGIIAVDTNGNIMHHNSAALDLTEANPSAPERGNYRFSKMEPLLKRAMEEGGRYTADWKLGDGRQIIANISPVLDESGQTAIGAVALLRDISESARLEQMRRDYIANISHELRTPLTGIRGMVEPLIDGVIEEEEKQSCYRIIYQETIRLQKLIGDMLDMSKLQDGRIEFELEEMDIASICENICIRMSSRAAETGVLLKTDICGEYLTAMGNEDRIVQILVILLDNAFSFTPSGGEIVVFCRKDEKHLYFGVRDTGAGIDPRDLPYIWERFFKADRSRMRTSGTGLGLAIAKLAVEHMNGTIDVSSVVGRGSTFTVRLPL